MNSSKTKNRLLYRLFSVLVICTFTLWAGGCTSRTDRFLRDNAEAFIPEEQEGSDENTGEEEREEPAENAPSVIYVDVCGHVACPGVYKFSEGSRVYEAIEAAGGFTEDAAVTAVNRAQFLNDTMQLYIPSREEFLGSGDTAAEDTACPGSSSAPDDGRIDLNTADMDQLCELPGIGESKASAILAYRDKYGPFSGVEELMQVNGIKEGTFAKIKDRIAVR